MKTLRVDVWSDIACPWCFVGKRRLEQALSRFEQRDAVRVTWRAFELDPAALRVSDTRGPYTARLARKYGCGAAQAQAMIDRMVAVGAADGIVFDFENIRPGNTFDAHRVLHLAAEGGLQDALKERYLQGYLSEGEAIGDQAVLLRLAGQAGLDVDRVSALLASDDFAADVRADEEQARLHDIQGVPFFVFGGRYAVSGAQPAEVLLRVLEQSFQELGSEPEDSYAEGAACGPDGC
ncbi:MAG TPA: DsbA family oxidoreductase, partial [Polyangiaceae bacterium]|nr:DsbA family oxidoreductase [Polyangiaceae bacterium]